MADKIIVRGAREHNLRNISVDLPRDKLIVFTGLSGNLARQQHPDCKESNVVVDGIPRAGVNYVPPSQVAGIEAYRDGTTAPAPYRSDCGLIVIWTKHYRPVPRPRFSP